MTGADKIGFYQSCKGESIIKEILSIKEQERMKSKCFLDSDIQCPRRLVW